MKKITLLNSHLSHTISQMGHTDTLVVCDAGLPISSSVHCIDLALSKGIPSFLDTVKITLSELFIEKVTIAEEITEKNPHVKTQLLAIIQETEKQQGNKIEICYVPHEQFKKMTHHSKGIVRTGECSPYANIIFHSGVPF